MATSGGRPFQPPNPAPGALDIRFGEAIGLGLRCRNLSKSVNPWFGIIPVIRKISAQQKENKEEIFMIPINKESERQKNIYFSI